MDNIELRIKADRAIRNCLANMLSLIKLATFTYNKDTDDYTLSILANDNKESNNINTFLFNLFGLKNEYIPGSDRWLVYNKITEEQLEELTTVTLMLGNL